MWSINIVSNLLWIYILALKHGRHYTENIRKITSTQSLLAKIILCDQFGDWRAQSLIMGTSYKDAQLQFKEGTSVL